MKKLYVFEAEGFRGVFVADATIIANIIGKTIVLEEDDWHDYRLTHEVCAEDFTELARPLSYLDQIVADGLVPSGFALMQAEILED